MLDKQVEQVEHGLAGLGITKKAVKSLSP